MKTIVTLLLLISTSICSFADSKYRIKVLHEISYQQSKDYPKKWEISIYTHTNTTGTSITRYFLPANSIKHDSKIILINKKQSTCPWKVLIDGSYYYAEFNNEEELQAGDEGVVKYEGNVLYFYKDE